MADNKTAHKQFMEGVFNNNNLGAVDQWVDPNMVDHCVYPGYQAGGPDGIKQYATEFHKAFPDLQVSIDDQIEEGDKLTGRYTLSGTHQGTFFGIPPTGKKVQWSGIDIYRIANGKVVEHWGYWDSLGLRQQLGASQPTSSNP